MGRNKNIIPTVIIKACLPEDLAAKVTLHLFSEVEGRVPQGKYQEFFSRRIIEYFESRRLDLAPWTGQPADTFFVSGSPDSISLLKRTLDEDMEQG